jgi:hypothetical protein
MLTAHPSTSYLFFAGCFGAVKSSVADPGSGAFLTPGPGSGIGFFPDPGSGAFLTPRPGSGIGFFPDPGSQTHIFESLLTHFWVKKSIILSKTGPNIFLQHFKNKIIYNFGKFGTTKKGKTTNFFSPVSFVAVFGSGIRDV